MKSVIVYLPLGKTPIPSGESQTVHTSDVEAPFSPRRLIMPSAQRRSVMIDVNRCKYRGSHDWSDWYQPPPAGLGPPPSAMRSCKDCYKPEYRSEP